ncbi:MAG: DUF349 domain-containing protein [Bacteroidales bacterium]|nr:DUF349 domain-containing protein [Bacteroidales bacterium]
MNENKLQTGNTEIPDEIKPVNEENKQEEIKDKQDEAKEASEEDVKQEEKAELKANIEKKPSIDQTAEVEINSAPAKIPEEEVKTELTVEQPEQSESETVEIDLKTSEEEKTDEKQEIPNEDQPVQTEEKEIAIEAAAEPEQPKPSDETAEADQSELTEVETPGSNVSDSTSKDLDHEDDDEDDEDDDESEDEDDDTTRVDYNQFSRKELVDLLEQTVQEGEVDAIKNKVALIKVAFLKLNKEEQEKRFESYLQEGGEEESYEAPQDDTEVRFNAAFSIYKDKKSKWMEHQEELKQKNLETKKLILEELKALIESEESLKTTYDEFRTLQEKWKEAGMVPKSEVNNLWQSYHFYVEKFFDKVKINKELRDLDLKKNLETKIELCESAEELLLETSIIKSFKKLQDLHRQWKETGPVPADKKDEIWDRFKDATDKINQRRREHYNKIKEDQKNNLLAKTALCEKAEEILSFENLTIKDWQENTDKISELLKVWKTIGPAPRVNNDEIWDRFKTSLDTFFAGKKEFFQGIKEEQMNNYNMKLDLCSQAEALKTSTDWRNTTQDLINLQKEWKQIGPVPKRHSDKIWKRFRAACDEFFNSKSAFFANIKTHEAENLKKKEDLITQVEAFEFGSDKSKNLELLKDFQRQWTDIGHVPFKEKDRVQSAFRNAINKQLDKLNINKAEMQTVNYKQRIENLKDRPNSGRIIHNERNFLIGKRKQLEDDIKLWENNMGFLASSKKADLLKEEFEKKIEKVKTEIEVLTEKIKFLERETD